ncbi:MAG: hypothetical protein ACLFQV_12670 [Vulcanimicrobiota bacterium]
MHNKPLADIKDIVKSCFPSKKKNSRHYYVIFQNHAAFYKINSNDARLMKIIEESRNNREEIKVFYDIRDLEINEIEKLKCEK